MSTGGEAADQVVSMTLKGVDVTMRLAGTGAKELTMLLYSLLKSEGHQRGKTGVANMLKSGKELKVFALKEADLEKFCKAAKEYGVLYCVLKNKKSKDGLCDVMARAEDASKINRIFERYGLATVDTATIHSEVNLAKELLGKEQGEATPNPTTALSEQSPLSEPIYEPKGEAGISRGLDEERRPSVLERLRQLRAERTVSPSTGVHTDVRDHHAPKKKFKWRGEEK